MADEAYLQGGDNLSEANIGQWFNAANRRGYIESGGGLTPDFGANEVTVEAGEVYLADSNKLFKIFPSKTTLTLPDSNGVNYVYARFEPGTDDSAEWVVDSTQGGPADPKVLHATVDTSSNTSTRENEEPVLDANLVVLNDDGDDPSNNGEIANNGGDVKVFSGGSVRNFNDIGTGGAFQSRVDVTSTSTTLSPADSAWVDTAAAGAAVTVTLPADGDTSDGDRVEVGIEDASNDTDVSANTGQSIIGNNPTLTQAGDSLTFEFKSSNSTWMVR